MPDLATTDSTIKVIRWLVEIDKPVQRGQALLEVETDKATMEVESIATGRLLTQHAQPGDDLSAGQPLASLEVEGPAQPQMKPVAGADAPTPAPATPPPVPPITTPKAGGMFARNRAAQNPLSGTP